uniref:Uncharacterized protein n=1 Tax=Physcomitrium patens TaxID=3218 RepID=A0A2K1IQQ0_PHYPA|nr:hypothetical protein PHYPA_025708 [Physcomitrium patens]
MQLILHSGAPQRLSIGTLLQKRLQHRYNNKQSTTHSSRSRHPDSRASVVSQKSNQREKKTMRLGHTSLDFGSLFPENKDLILISGIPANKIKLGFSKENIDF